MQRGSHDHDCRDLASPSAIHPAHPCSNPEGCMTRRVITQPVATPDCAPGYPLARHPCPCPMRRRLAATQSGPTGLAAGAPTGCSTPSRPRSRNPRRPRTELRLRSNPQERDPEPAASFKASYGHYGRPTLRSIPPLCSAALPIEPSSLSDIPRARLSLLTATRGSAVTKRSGTTSL